MAWPHDRPQPEPYGWPEILNLKTAMVLLVLLSGLTDTEGKTTININEFVCMFLYMYMCMHVRGQLTVNEQLRVSRASS